MHILKSILSHIYHITSIALMLAIGVAYYMYTFATTPLLKEGQGEQYILTVAKGNTLRTVANQLVKDGIINHSIPFILLGKLNDAGQHIKAGVYLVNKETTPISLLINMDSGV